MQTLCARLLPLRINPYAATIKQAEMEFSAACNGGKYEVISILPQQVRTHAGKTVVKLQLLNYLVNNVPGSHLFLRHSLTAHAKNHARTARLTSMPTTQKPVRPSPDPL